METPEHAQARREARMRLKFEIIEALSKGVSPESAKDLVDSVVSMLDRCGIEIQTRKV